MTQKKVAAGFRLSMTAQELLSGLALKMGVSKTAVVEIAVRQMAERERVTTEPSTADVNDPERGKAQ